MVLLKEAEGIFMMFSNSNSSVPVTYTEYSSGKKASEGTVGDEQATELST